MGPIVVAGRMVTPIRSAGKGLVYTAAGAVAPRHTTPAPTTLRRATTLPGQMIAFAPSHAPSPTVIGSQKKRNSGSFQS